MTSELCVVDIHICCDALKLKNSCCLWQLPLTFIVSTFVLLQQHTVCRCPWGKKTGWRSRAALLAKCWHKQKADSLLCQVGRQGEQLVMNSKLIFIARLHSSQGVYWSECSYKVSFAEPSRHADCANHVCTHTQSTHRTIFILLMSVQSVIALFQLWDCQSVRA